MPNNSSEISALREQMKRHARPRFKTADMSGDMSGGMGGGAAGGGGGAATGGTDSTFEQAFSNIAHAFLRDKAPSLLDYEVGFQLIDRNQENTKAIGVAGFKVGPQWLYAPVFFLNGDLKGHELLYIKNQDMFVPLKENWLNYILNRKPNVLGTETGRNLSEVGVMPPHLYQLSRSPNKFASASPWVKEALPTIAYWATVNPRSDKKYESIVDLPSFLKKEGKSVIRSLVLGFKENPKLASTFEQFHGLAVIDEALEEIKKQQKEASSTSVLKEAARCRKTPQGVRCFEYKQPKSVLTTDKPNEVNTEPGDTIKTAGIGDPLDSHVRYALQKKIKVITYDEVVRHGTGLEGLDSKERSKLLKDRVLIKDERPEAEIAYEVTSPVRLQNPDVTGLYDVLVKPSKFEKCLVIFGPHSQRGRKEFVTLVRVSDGDNEKGRAWLNIHPSNIWVSFQYKNEDFQDWWDKLKEAKDLPVSRRGLHILIGNTGEGSLPFEVEKEVAGDSYKSYDVYFKSYAEKERADHLPPINTRLMHYRGAYDEEHGSRITFTGKKGAQLRAAGGDLYVPTDYKLLTLKPAGKDSDDYPCFNCDSHSDPSPIQPGNMLDIELLLGIKTASVKIYDAGTEVEINNTRMQKLAALVHLVRDWGLREKQARILLKRAADNKVARFRIKKSEQSYDLQKTGPNAPGIPETPTGYDVMTGGSVPTQNPGEWNIKIPEMSAALTDRMIYHPMGPEPDYQQPAAPDRHAQQAAMQAAQTGQKEIFDTAMIGSLLKSVRDDSMVDRYMGDLMKGLDRLGRILFLFYWHGEKFQDRYGKADMVELEDGIRNAFEYLGDLVLFLKQRSVGTPDDHSDINLSSISA